VRHNAWEIVLALWCFGFSALYAWTNPPFEAPDEPAHLSNVNFLSSEGRLPNAEKTGENTGQAHQHPLYYALSAGLVRIMEADAKVNHRLAYNPQFRPVLEGERAQPRYLHGSDFETVGDRRAFVALRLLNAVFAGLAVLAIGRASRLVLPGLASLAAPAVAAFLPQFQFLSGSLTNDTLTALFAALAMWAAAAAWRRRFPRLWDAEAAGPIPGRVWLALGVAIALAVLTKKSGLILALPAVLLAVWIASSGKGKLLAAALVALPIVLALAPIVARNQALYGEPLTHRLEERIGAGHLAPKAITDRYFATTFPKVTAISFVAHFGWMSVPIPAAAALGAAALLAGGILLSLVRARGPTAPLLAFLWGICLLNLAGHAYYNLSFNQPQGRYLFYCLPAAAALFALGWEAAGRTLPAQPRKALALGLPVAAAAFDIACWMVNARFYETAG
jgi:4-amino-4-deoxy-L-arabinose transferase-like glycosyltransferase